ncbi:MAG: tRNA (adenosine(37)-N6)-threonylcarbamoyltransferase complex ATPase subunit type 1 TsaE [Defluviitaleaceae bacterium]|nr:tRNA (adenosine(37)-N6)-threonylcarbamoyltransferase complex ATPase subunit type 1 TsaE [Defluviitaleaceae bacterium]
MTIQSFSPEDTEQLGFMVGKEARPGDVFCLSGGLGAGKTVFTRGLARALGYDGHVTSPTFSLMNEYEGVALKLYHFDLYRLETEEDMESIGYEDYFFGDGVCLVEWPERAGDLIPVDAIWLKIDTNLTQDNYDYREITVL